jgi:hypothetical protein
MSVERDRREPAVYGKESHEVEEEQTFMSRISAENVT